MESWQRKVPNFRLDAVGQAPDQGVDEVSSGHDHEEISGGERWGEEGLEHVLFGGVFDGGGGEDDEIEAFAQPPTPTLPPSEMGATTTQEVGDGAVGGDGKVDIHSIVEYENDDLADDDDGKVTSEGDDDDSYVETRKRKRGGSRRLPASLGRDKSGHIIKLCGVDG